MLDWDKALCRKDIVHLFQYFEKAVPPGCMPRATLGIFDKPQLNPITMDVGSAAFIHWGSQIEGGVTLQFRWFFARLLGHKMESNSVFANVVLQNLRHIMSTHMKTSHPAIFLSMVLWC